MKKWKIIFSILLIVGLLVSGAGTIVYFADFGKEHADRSAAEPKRPDDPGTIAPLEKQNVLPEDGVVWDMENIPDDLLADGWAAAEYSGNDEWTEDNVKILGEDGKGYEGSRALGIRQNGRYSWTDVYSIGIGKDETAFCNWAAGDVLSFWYDTTGLSGSFIMLEIEVNSTHLQMGIPYYIMDEDGSAWEEGSIPEGYDNAGYGRVPLPANSRGRIGLQLSGYAADLRRVESIRIHLAGQPGEGILYLDDFRVLTSSGFSSAAEMDRTGYPL